MYIYKKKNESQQHINSKGGHFPIDLLPKSKNKYNNILKSNNYIKSNGNNNNNINKKINTSINNNRIMNNKDFSFIDIKPPPIYKTP